MIIPLWFALFVVAVLVLPLGTFVGSLFLLVLGLAVPALVYVVWRDPALQPVVTERRRIDSQRTT